MTCGILSGMQAPLFVRPPTEEERQALAAGLRSADAFTLRRSQIVLASARGERAPAIARALGCSDQTVRNAIRAFDRAARRRWRKAPPAPTPSTPPSMRREPSGCGRCCTAPRATSATPPASGPWNWRRRWRSPRDSPLAASATRRCAPRWPGSASAGAAPRTGSPAPTRRTPKKTSAATG